MSTTNFPPAFVAPADESAPPVAPVTPPEPELLQADTVAMLNIATIAPTVNAARSDP
jgi:hypothetical protein